MDADIQVRANKEHTTTVSESNKPVHKVKAGPVVATIWANEVQSDNGPNVYYTISLDRAYKDKEDWKHTNSLRTNDLPKAQLVLAKAYEWLALTEQ